MIFRICTEAKNVKQILRLAGTYFQSGYTLFQGLGAWDGKEEKSLCIEIAVMSASDTLRVKSKVKHLARDIKRVNQQDAVLIEEIPSANLLI